MYLIDNSLKLCIFQGLSEENPIVKVNNQVFRGEVVSTIGSDLLFEVEETDGELILLSLKLNDVFKILII